MKITGINIYNVALTSRITYAMAEGKTCDTVDSMVVEVRTDGGVSGWGEVCAIPHYLPAYARGVAPAVAELGRRSAGAFVRRLELRRRPAGGDSGCTGGAPFGCDAGAAVRVAHRMRRGAAGQRHGDENG